MEMKRGDVVIFAGTGDYENKPRPALVVQSDLFAAVPSVTVLPITSFLVDAEQLRVDLIPDEMNGLKKHSQVAVDKITTARKEKVRAIVGHVGDAQMEVISQRLARFLGIDESDVWS